MEVWELKHSKKELRMEKKKKRLNALLTIATLNNNDGRGRLPNSDQEQTPDVQDCSAAKKSKKESAESVSNVDGMDFQNGHENLKDSACNNLSNGDSETQNQDYKKLKAEEKKLISGRKKPNLLLKTPGNQASLSTYVADRVPILFTDVQHLLLNSTIGHKSPYLPLRWCHLEKSNKISHTVVTVVEGVSLYDFCAWESHFEFAKYLPHQLEVVTPSLYSGSTIDELAVIPLTDLEKESLVKEYGSMDAAMETRKDLMSMMRAVFPVKAGLRPNLSSDEIKDNFSRTQLVLSTWQLVEENYPLPLKGKLKTSYSDYKMTKDEYEPVSASSPLFAIDCEMCRTRSGLELTRITVVNEEYQVIYETYVLPYNKITDYLTAYSGITEKKLSNVATRLEDVQKTLIELLPPNAILVGQSLNFDLHALKMMHPYIIDTSIIFNMTGDRTRKTKLKHLAKQFLKKNIQVGANGHCSLEDAVTSLKLVKLKLAKHLAFGDAILKSKQNVEEYDHLKTKHSEYASSIFNQVIPKNKSCLIVGSEKVLESYSKYLKGFHNDDSDSKVKVICENENAAIIDNISNFAKDFNLTLAHLNFESQQLTNVDTFTTLGNWIDKIWENIEDKCLTVVILAGNETCNGAIFIGIKKNKR
ncbi:RNA exonuclease 5 [Arctopsyche grandis]|uniref:RNA exonuclease 5 n=1 Tax=Arctopsyche grandis TaxID=121162 RepID=UPI00406D844A